VRIVWRHSSASAEALGADVFVELCLLIASVAEADNDEGYEDRLEFVLADAPNSGQSQSLNRRLAHRIQQPQTPQQPRTENPNRLRPNLDQQTQTTLITPGPTNGVTPPTQRDRRLGVKAVEICELRLLLRCDSASIAPTRNRSYGVRNDEQATSAGSQFGLSPTGSFFSDE
jgi:hypothetical protein